MRNAWETGSSQQGDISPALLVPRLPFRETRVNPGDREGSPGTPTCAGLLLPSPLRACSSGGHSRYTLYGFSAPPRTYSLFPLPSPGLLDLLAPRSPGLGLSHGLLSHSWFLEGKAINKM